MRRVVAVALVLGTLALPAMPAAAAEQPAIPDRWDPRVKEYVEFVEEHRGLEFEHPVNVRFLDDAAFVRAYRADDPQITAQDRREAERIAGQLRALGLVEGPIDLIALERDLGATDTVGFYDQERKALYVRGTDLSDTDVRITLVHELTHALQDQQFDLTKLDRQVETSGEDFALTALVEGDATYVEDDYLFSLPESEQDAYFDDVPEGSTSADVPPVLDLFTGGPYVFGSRFVAVLRETGGRARLDRAFAKLPVSEEEIVDPVAARDARRPKRLAAPELAPDEQRRGQIDDFGALSLYLVLASRIDPETALRAAEGWGGDRYVGFTRRDADTRECVRIALTGDTARDTAEIADAVAQWAATLPPGASSSTRADDRVELTACDTGTTPAPSEETLDTAVTLLVDRNDLALELLRLHTPPRVARCAGDRLAADREMVELLGEADFTPAQEDRFTTLLTGALRACRSR